MIKPESVATSGWNRNCIPWQTDLWYFPGNQGHAPETGSGWPYIPSKYSKVENYETENKIYTDFDYKRKKTSSNLDFNFILLPSSATNNNRVGRLSSSVLFILGKWCSLCCSNRVKLFVNGRFTCLVQVSITFWSSAMTPPNFCTPQDMEISE